MLCVLQHIQYRQLKIKRDIVMESWLDLAMKQNFINTVALK